MLALRLSILLIEYLVTHAIEFSKSYSSYNGIENDTFWCWYHWKLNNNITVPDQWIKLILV